MLTSVVRGLKGYQGVLGLSWNNFTSCRRQVKYRLFCPPWLTGWDLVVHIWKIPPGTRENRPRPYVLTLRFLRTYNARGVNSLVLKSSCPLIAKLLVSKNVYLYLLGGILSTCTCLILGFTCQPHHGSACGLVLPLANITIILLLHLTLWNQFIWFGINNYYN